jgi:hypothetical protein
MFQSHADTFELKQSLAELLIYPFGIKYISMHQRFLKKSIKR